MFYPNFFAYAMRILTQFRHKGTTFFSYMQTFPLFFVKIGCVFLHICKKSSTFAPDLDYK